MIMGGPSRPPPVFASQGTDGNNFPFAYLVVLFSFFISFLRAASSLKLFTEATLAPAPPDCTTGMPCRTAINQASGTLPSVGHRDGFVDSVEHERQLATCTCLRA